MPSTSPTTSQKMVVARAGHRWPAFDKFTNDVPLVLIENGRPIDDRLEKSRVNEDDVLAQARMQQGQERMDQIKYAVLERNGGISIIPRSAE